MRQIYQKLSLIALVGIAAGLCARPAAAADSPAAIQTSHRMSAVGVGLTLASGPVTATGGLVFLDAAAGEVGDLTTGDNDNNGSAGFTAALGLMGAGATMGGVGVPLMSASQLVTASRLKRSGAEVPTWAGWTAAGSAVFAVSGLATGFGLGIGYVSAATFGTIQHVQNGRAGRESGALTAAPARKVNLALAPAQKGVRLIGTF